MDPNTTEDTNMNASIKALASKRDARLAEARTVISRAKREHRGLSAVERMRAEDLLDEARAANRRIKRLEGAERTADHIIHDAVEGGGLLNEFKAAGWRPGERTYIDDPGFRAGASFSGNVEEISPVRVEGAPLGLDARYIHPAFPTAGRRQRGDARAGAVAVGEDPGRPRGRDPRHRCGDGEAGDVQREDAAGGAAASGGEHRVRHAEHHPGAAELPLDGRDGSAQRHPARPTTRSSWMPSRP